MAATLTKSPRETHDLAKKIAKKLKAKRGPVILALCGELGSGKTTFVQGLAKALGLRVKVKSPTFVLVKLYKLSRRGKFKHFVHVDAYRMKNVSEAKSIGLAEVFKDKRAIAVVEWAERIKKLIPKNAIWFTFKHKAKSQRLITMGNTKTRSRMSNS